MNRKEEMRAALEGKQPSNAVPLWELEFHLWDQASPKKMTLGNEFKRLSRAIAPHMSCDTYRMRIERRLQKYNLA